VPAQLNGFHGEFPGILYLIRHDQMNAVKVGICNRNARQERLKDHQEQGWTIVHTFTYEDGWEAAAAEARVMCLWKGITGYLLPSQMPFGGATETIDADAFDESAVLGAIANEAAPRSGDVTHSDRN
jgi:hypothetical protein